MSIMNGTTPFKLSGNANPFWTYGAPRDIFSNMFNGSAVAYEDYMRDLQKMELTNEFNAQEAQKQRDFEERLSNTAYTRAVEDMKNAGINPLLAVSQGGASTPSGASASGSTVTSSSSQGQNALGLFGTLLQIVAGIYNNGASNAVKTAIAKGNNATALKVANTTRKSESYSQVLNLGSKKFKK